MPHHSVYVIELRPDVLKRRRFAAANPERRADKPCVYVGLTGIAPEVRFQQHRDGYKACRLVREFGVRLRPRLYAKYNPMPYAEAARRERALAAKLRKRGYAVWQK